MRRPVLITTPYPTPEEVARVYGISERRAVTLRKLVEDSIDKKVYFSANGNGFSANKNGGARKALGSKRPASAETSKTKRAKSRGVSRRKLTRAKAKSPH
jgi:hypothetical protein